MQDLGTLGGDESAAYGVSANGDIVVGWAEDHNKQRRAFYWQGGNMYDLGTLGGDNSEACGISASGELVVGWSENAQGSCEAFYYEKKNSQMKPLSTPNGYLHSFALGISAEPILVCCGMSGWQVKFAAVGYAESKGSPPQALLWEITQNLFQSSFVASNPQILNPVSGTCGCRAYSCSFDAFYGPSSDEILRVIGESKDQSGCALLWIRRKNLQNQNATTSVNPINIACNTLKHARRLPRLEVAYGISSLRTYPRLIVGWGNNPYTGRMEAILLEMP